eukprot:scaffold108950_cov32-Tisochrysis_lutea.AAC.3
MKGKAVIVVVVKAPVSATSICTSGSTRIMHAQPKTMKVRMSGHRGRQLQREAAQYRRRHGAIQNLWNQWWPPGENPLSDIVPRHPERMAGKRARLECGGVRVLHRQIGNDGARGMRERTAAHGT